MPDQSIMENEDFQRCVRFHGHICPGLSLGYRAAKTAMSVLAENRAEDEEIVALVETNACFADAVQVLTGCTFGKGNFIYEDYGKLAMTLFSRTSGRGVRVSIRSSAAGLGDEHSALLKKIALNEANDRERERFNQLHLARAKNLLEMNSTCLFKIEETDRQVPPEARIAPSQPCDQCLEPTMATKLVHFSGRLLCRACIDTGQT